ncbi:radical SAM family heme chaperone HemW [Flavitalea sp.]|nr:radical SAM family heme chaperone HemW [Flavitalea sp.]
MAGIYLHIPFCRQACHYCNFHFSTSLNLKDDFLKGILAEIELRHRYLGGKPVNTIYFGGGTPSLLEQNELDSILDKVHKHYQVSTNAEITFEANPDDITSEKLAGWKTAGINRLSMGVQSFYEEDLQWMNRAHNAGQALDSIKMVQDQGFSNLTIDLIYGSPGLTDEKWRHNVNKAIDLGIPHLSCYALTVEPKTALANMISKKKSDPVQTEDQARQFLLLMDWLQAEGYEHYEISNFAKPGMHSRHNSAYWSGEAYLGFGPSAHSYNGLTRQWNIANNPVYIQSLLAGNLPFEIEQLSERDRHNEYIMISLRKREGILKSVYSELFGENHYLALSRSIKKHINRGSITENDSSYSLTKEGKLFADGISADLFI